jgi:hypothetical protein
LQEIIWLGSPPNKIENIYYTQRTNNKNMKLKLIQRKANYLSFLILLAGILFISGCVSQNASEDVASQNSPEAVVQPTEGLQIVLKDPGMPEVKYLQPTVKGVQLQNEGGKWITIWSNPEGKALKLTPDGAENVLDTVSIEAGTYVATRLLVSTIDVGVDINRDGDTLDKNQEIVLTEEEFKNLPPQQKPSAPVKPLEQLEQSKLEEPSQPPELTAPAKPVEDKPQGEEPGEESPEPSEPSKPEEPSKPSEPTAPSEPEAPWEYCEINGLVYICTGEYLDEKHTATSPFWDGIAEHYGEYLYPVWKNDFSYNGISGKIIYDFTLHPLLPKHEQISVEASTANPPLED